MAGDQNLGEWDARPVDPIPEVGGQLGHGVARSPDALSPDPGDDRARRASGRVRDSAFWLGVIVGLVPLVALVAGLIGYRLASGDDGSDAAEISLDAGAGTGPGASTDVVTPPTSGGGDDTALTVETAPASPSSTSGVIVAGPLIATGTVADDTIELAGVLPASTRARWIPEIAALAEALGRRLVDATEEVVADGGGEGAAEMTVGFPGAVVFQEQSPSFFDGDPTAVFEAVAGLLNQGSARLNIVGYADPSEPEAVDVALARAEHVHEHLVDLAVDPARLTVEARPLDEAPGTNGDEGPVDRRADLEFRFASR